MLKKILGLGILLCLVSLAYAQEEKITITTYYPSPYGSYRELRAQRMAIGETWYNGATACWPGEACANQIYSDLNNNGSFDSGEDLVDLVVQGNVGIGTSDPNKRLVIGAGGFQVLAGGNSSGWQPSSFIMDFDHTDVDGGPDTTRIWTVGSGNVGYGGNRGRLAIYTMDGSNTAGAPHELLALMVGNDARIGIGPTAGIPRALLDIRQAGNGPEDGISINNAAGGDTRRQLFVDDSGTFHMRWAATGTDVVIDNNSKVGIGALHPGRTLDVSSSGTGNTTGLRIGNTAPGGAMWGLTVAANNDINGAHPGSFYLRDDSFGGVKFLIRQNGRIGMGTVDPEVELHVKSSSPEDGNADIGLESDDGYKWTMSVGRTGEWGLNRDIPGTLPVIIADQSGNVSIGKGAASSGYRLELPNTAGSGGKGIANRWETYSSIRWKENVAQIETNEALTKVMQLNPVHFRWKKDYGNKDDTGFIAEEVGRVIPEAVQQEGEYADGLSTDQIIAYLTKVVQEQQERIEALEATLKD